MHKHYGQEIFKHWVFHGATNFKKEYLPIFERFEKVYIHSEEDTGATQFIAGICKVLPPEKLYKITSKKVDATCKDPSALHIKNILDFNTLIGTAEKIELEHYNKIVNAKIESVGDPEQQEEENHVRIAKQIMDEMYIYYFKEDFYVYNKGVYVRNKNAVENKILEIEPNAKKYLRTEILEYIRIRKTINEASINPQFINFRNGMYDLINKRLIEHSPKYFTTCQINANYIPDEELQENEYIEKFLNDVTCYNKTTGKNLNRKLAVLQMIGYSMTYRVDLSKAFFLYGPSANNGKSTAIEMINNLIGKENISHLTFKQLGDRFTGSELTDKILNTETEIEKDIISNIETFKKVVSGDEISVEEKYKSKYHIKPFCKFIWGTNNLPQLNGIADEGFYRRINIIPFERKFETKEEEKFDKNKILTPEALDYLANISIRAYLNMNGKLFANEKESKQIVKEYRDANNSVKAFLQNTTVINEVFVSSNKVQKTALYGQYVKWCKEKRYFVKSKTEFYDTVLSNTEYVETTLNGLDYIQNVSIEKDGTGAIKNIEKKDEPPINSLQVQIDRFNKHLPFGGISVL